MRISRFFVCSAFGCVLFAFIAATPAHAQSDSELRRENQRLRTQVDELKKELEAALERIAALQEQMRQRRAGGNTRLPSDQPEEEKVSIDESEPMASPRALLKALQASYTERFAELEMGEARESRERDNYLQSVVRWGRQAERKFKRPVQWHLRFEEIERQIKGGYVIRAHAVDPEYGTTLGSSFRVMLPRARTSVIEKHGMGATYAVRGTLTPYIGVNDERQETGPFNSPPLVGAFAELDLVLDIQTVQVAGGNEQAPSASRSDRR